MEYHHRILHIPFTLGSKFQLQQKILIFLEQIYPQKEFFRSKNNQKMNITIKSFILELAWVPNFSLNWQF